MYYYVGLVLVENDGSVLLQKRDDKPGISSPGMYSICGGKAEPTDVDLVAAAIRELREESGYIAKPDDLVLLDEDSFWASGQEIRRVFYWARYDGRQTIGCFEGESIRFYGPDEINRLDFCDYSHKLLALEATEEKRRPTSFERR